MTEFENFYVKNFTWLDAVIVADVDNNVDTNADNYQLHKNPYLMLGKWLWLHTYPDIYIQVVSMSKDMYIHKLLKIMIREDPDQYGYLYLKNCINYLDWRLNVMLIIALPTCI